MIMQLPEVSFVRVFPEIVTTTSTENEIAVCMQSGQMGDNSNPTMVTQQRYCQLMISPESSSSNQDELCTTYPAELNAGQETGNKIAEKAIKEATGVSATNAPVRSAPHFNNDLFN